MYILKYMITNSLIEDHHYKQVNEKLIIVIIIQDSDFDDGQRTCFVEHYAN